MQTIEMPVETTLPVTGDDGVERVPSKVAAARLGVVPSRVRQLLGKGQLKGIKDDKDDWLVDVTSIERYRKYQEAREAARNFLKGESTDE